MAIWGKAAAVPPELKSGPLGHRPEMAVNAKLAHVLVGEAISTSPDLRQGVVLLNFLAENECPLSRKKL